MEVDGEYMSELKLEFLRVWMDSQENSAMEDGREDISERSMVGTEGGGGGGGG